MRWMLDDGVRPAEDSGNQRRALWLYPFSAAQVLLAGAAAVRRIVSLLYKSLIGTTCSGAALCQAVQKQQRQLAVGLFYWQLESCKRTPERQCAAVDPHLYPVCAEWVVLELYGA